MTKQTYQSIIALLFILSGVTGLIYQIVWFKYLSLFLGNTTYAQTIVLATFMGGLAIGASLWGRRADGVKDPVKLYAFLELGIALYCFLFPTINTVVRELFFDVVHAADLQIGSVPLLALKLTVSVLMLLIPTILMGGTLPVLVKGITANIRDSGTSVAVLYFLNSFGAVVGSLLGGFFLIRMLGLEMTIISAAVMNLLIGAAAFLLARSGHRIEAVLPSQDKQEKEIVFTDRQIRIAVLVAGISGLSSMIYEVIWVRMLTPVFGSSTYSFSLMLIAFISGITLGSALVSKRIRSMKNTFGFLAFCQFGVVISMLLSLPLYGRIPYTFWKLSTILHRSDSTYPLYLTLELIICFLIMFIPTIFLGMTLPVASRIASRSVEQLGKTVGNVFSVNTIGTVIGSLAAGLFLIPTFGIQRSVEIALAVNLIAGALVLTADSITTAARKMMMIALVVAVGSGYTLMAGEWSKLMFFSGVFRMLVNEQVQPPKSFAEFVFRTDQKRELYYKEGTTATVGVVEANAAGKMQNVLIVNGKSDASSVGDLPTQVLLAHMPMLLHPDASPDSALIIGYGSGVTAGSLLTHDVRSVDCVEISPEVMEASRYFEHVNGRPLNDPRFKLSLEDANAFLRLTKNRYDVIISEPSNPWIAGIGNLYSVDFFKTCKAKLKENGLMVQWFHLYEIDDEIFKLVLRTFRTQFPHVTVWHSLKNDVLLIGSGAPIELSNELLAERMGNLNVNRDLARVGLNHIPSLLSLQSLSSANAMDYAGFGPVNTEDAPYLEYNAPRAFFTGRKVTEYRMYDERANVSSEDLFLSSYIKSRPLTTEDRFKIALVQSDADRGEPKMAYSLLSSLHEELPNDQEVMIRLSVLAGQLGKDSERIGLLKELYRLRPNDPSVISQYAWFLFAKERGEATYLQPKSVSESEKMMQRCIELTKDTVDVYHIRLADMYYATQQFSKAVTHYSRVLALRERFGYATQSEATADILYNLSRSYYHLGNLGKALEYGAHASIESPDSEEIKDYIYKIAMRQLEKND